MTEKRYFLHKHLGRDVIHDILCHNWLKGEELEEHMNVQYTKYSALKKENEELESMCDAVREELGLADRDNTVLLKENEQLKQELFESEKEYLIETYSDNSVRKNDKIHSLKKEFKERFGRDFE